MRVLGSLATAILLSACGSPISDQPGGGRPTPVPPLVAVIDRPGEPGNTLRLVGLDGHVVASVTAPTPFDSLEFVGSGGSRAVYLERTDTSSTLKALHRDGSTETLYAFQGVYPTGIVLSPDGAQWIWTAWSSNGRMAHSALHLTSLDRGDRLIASLDADSQILAAYRWDAGGAIVEHRGLGIGGAFAPLGLGAFGDVYLLDLQSGALSPLLSRYPCQFHARAVDATVACLALDEAGTYTLHVGKLPNPAVSIPLDRTRFAGAGSISFKPGPSASVLVLGGSSRDPQIGWIKCSTDLVDVATGAIQHFGPEGLCPPGGGWVWLDDGSVIEFKPAIPQGSPQATPLTYLVSATGVGREISVGVPVGLLRD